MSLTLSLLIALSISPASASSGVELPSMAVTPIRSANLDQATLTILNNALLAGISDLNSFRVVGPADITAVIGLEATRQQLGCTDESCIAELAGALGTRYIFAATADILGDQMLLTASVFDQEETRSMARHRVTLKNDTAEFLGGIDQLLAGVHQKLVNEDKEFLSKQSKLLNTYHTHRIAPVFIFRPMMPSVRSCTTDQGEDCTETLQGGSMLAVALQYNWQIHPRLAFRLRAGRSVISNPDIDGNETASDDPNALSPEQAPTVFKGLFTSIGGECLYPIHHSVTQMPGASKQTVTLVAGIDLETHIGLDDTTVPYNGMQLNFFSGIRLWWLFVEVGGGVRFPQKDEISGVLENMDNQGYEADVGPREVFWSVNTGMAWAFD